MMGKKKFAEILGQYVTKPPGKLALVPESTQGRRWICLPRQMSLRRWNDVLSDPNSSCNALWCRHTKFFTQASEGVPAPDLKPILWRYKRYGKSEKFQRNEDGHPVPHFFANIWEPKAINGGDEKYSVSCLIPKSDKKTLARIQKAVEAAKEDGKARKWSGKIPPNLKLPLRDGDIDRPDDENYEDCYFLNASSKDAPQVVDRKVNPVLDPMMVYSGCYCNVSVNFYAFNANGNRGVAAGLGNIQFVRDGERLSGKASADADFDALEDDDEDVLGGDMPDYLN